MHTDMHMHEAYITEELMLRVMPDTHMHAASALAGILSFYQQWRVRHKQTVIATQHKHNMVNGTFIIYSIVPNRGGGCIIKFRFSDPYNFFIMHPTLKQIIHLKNRIKSSFEIYNRFWCRVHNKNLETPPQLFAPPPIIRQSRVKIIFQDWEIKIVI